MPYNTSDLYLELLKHSDALEKIYTCMQGDDFTDLAMTALEILRKTKTMRLFEKKWKSETTSTAFREEGNKAYFAGKYQTALKYYNQALLYAPSRSNAMVLAYSNRSALFQKTRNYSACLKDIETCLKLNCNKDIFEKLAKRKQDCHQNLWKEECHYTLHSGNYFKLDGKRHPQIPNITKDVKIVTDPETKLPKITAAKDIKVGTVIGVDKAFTNLLNPMNYYMCCYHCHRMSLNLVPCSNCIYALFCDNDVCRAQCLKESHSTECYIMEFLQGGFCGPYSKLSFRTVIKIKHLCSTWKEFIEASYSVGEEKMRKSSVEETFNSSHKFSMLSFVELREVKVGSMYNFSFMCATFLEQLIKLPFFLPNKPSEREEAIQALARMSMNLLLKFYGKIELNNVTEDRKSQSLMGLIPNNGYFAFASKLKHDCFGNILAVGLNDKVGLVAVQPIKKGTELTMSFVDHAYDFMHNPRIGRKERIIELFRFAQCCYCPACIGNWRSSVTLNDNQKKQYRRWLTIASTALMTNGTQGELGFKQTCDTLTSLHGLWHTTELMAVYGKLRSLLAICQLLESRNYGPGEN